MCLFFRLTKKVREKMKMRNLTFLFLLISAQKLRKGLFQKVLKFSTFFKDEDKLALDRLSKFIYGKLAELNDKKLLNNFMIDKDFESPDGDVYQLMFQPVRF